MIAVSGQEQPVMLAVAILIVIKPTETHVVVKVPVLQALFAAKAVVNINSKIILASAHNNNLMCCVKSSRLLMLPIRILCQPRQQLRGLENMSLLNKQPLFSKSKRANTVKSIFHTSKQNQQKLNKKKRELSQSIRKKLWSSKQLSKSIFRM